MVLRFCFSLVSLCFVFFGNCQSFKVRPFFGYKFYFDHVLDDKNALEGFRTNCGGSSPDGGLLLEYSTKNNWSYNFGVVHNAAGTSIGFDYNDIGIAAYGYSSQQASIFQYNFGINYQLKRMILFSKKELPSFENAKKNSRLNARLSLGAGIGFSALNRTQGYFNDNWSGGITTHGNDSINISVTNEYVKTSNTGYYLWGKAGFRFYRSGSEKFEVTIVFNQGLKTLYTNTNYEAVSKNGNTAVVFPATVGTRGTTLGFQLVFPIIIWENR